MRRCAHDDAPAAIVGCHLMRLGGFHRWLYERPAGQVPSAQRFFEDPPHYLRRNAVISLRRAIVRELLGDVPRRIIDVGCGDGSLSMQYLENGTELALVDVSSTMLESARSKVPETFLHRVRFCRLDISSAEFLRIASADVVLCVGVLAHMPDPEVTVGRVASLVEPGGRLLLQLTDFGRLAGKGVYWLSRVASRSRSYRLSETRIADVVRWARECGFDLVRTDSYSIGFPGYRLLPMQVQARMLRLIHSWPSMAPLRTESFLLFQKSAS